MSLYVLEVRHLTTHNNSCRYENDIRAVGELIVLNNIAFRLRNNPHYNEIVSDYCINAPHEIRVFNIGTYDEIYSSEYYQLIDDFAYTRNIEINIDDILHNKYYINSILN
jgi:hypothetical protein